MMPHLLRRLYENETWSTFVVVAWCAWMGLFIVFEAAAMWDGNMQTPPLTHVVVRKVAWWITMPFLTWLWIHFASRYLGRPIL